MIDFAGESDVTALGYNLELLRSDVGVGGEGRLDEQIQHKVKHSKTTGQIMAV